MKSLCLYIGKKTVELKDGGARGAGRLKIGKEGMATAQIGTGPYRNLPDVAAAA